MDRLQIGKIGDVLSLLTLFLVAGNKFKSKERTAPPLRLPRGSIKIHHSPEPLGFSLTFIPIGYLPSINVKGDVGSESANGNPAIFLARKRSGLNN